MDAATIKALYDRAVENQKRAYAPYSNFHVGAALMAEDGSIYDGANMENASFGATTCAERVALGTALFAGHRNFVALAVVGDHEETFPCGICRQALSEFTDGSMLVITAPDRVHRLDELLPFIFRLEHGAEE
ncbi:MAG: cytidine deaminase [Mogibacterium sp.]|nr:cytidine deaminase [Mogibacterium sp.]